MKDKAIEGPHTVIAGTYDGALVGFRSDSGEQIFGYNVHTGCVKATHCSKAGRLASGGTDQAVRLFDLAQGIEIGDLQEHEDNVVCVEFWRSTTLVTGGADGQICVWRCGDWELLLKFKAHKSSLSSIAIHPSGRMMATIGRDRSIRLWDLTRGTSAAVVPCEEAYEDLFWSPSGSHLGGLATSAVSITDISGGGTPMTFVDPASSSLMKVPMNAAIFLRQSEVLVGDGKGLLRVFGVDAKKKCIKEVCRLEDDSNRIRIKAIARPAEGQEVEAGSHLPFVVGTTSGRVELWHFTAPGTSSTAAAASQFKRLRVVETGCRLTTLALWPGLAKVAKLAGEDDEDEELFEEGEEEEENEEDPEVEEEEEVEEPQAAAQPNKRRRK